MTPEANELVTYAVNESNLYRNVQEAILKNLRKKIAKGVYDADKALILWKYHADHAAQLYTKEYKAFGPNGSYGIFTPAQRKEAAASLADHYNEELMEAA